MLPFIFVVLKFAVPTWIAKEPANISTSPVLIIRPFLRVAPEYVLNDPLMTVAPFAVSWPVVRVVIDVLVRDVDPNPLCVIFPFTVMVDAASVEGIVSVPTGGGYIIPFTVLRFIFCVDKLIELRFAI
jgi:hypothetical protein